MKKYKAIILSLILALALSACSPAPSTENDRLPVNTQATTPVQSNSTTETTGHFAAEVTLEEQVIFDKDGIKVTVKGLSGDDFFGPAVKVLVENGSDQNITVQTRNCSVNGLMMDPMFSCDVAAGKKANDTIAFMDSQLETAQISTIASIEFYLNIFDSDSWEDITRSDIITLNTSAADHVQTYNDSGFTVCDENGIKIVVQKLNSDDSFWGSDVYVYAENNTDANITIQARDVSIDGFMVAPMFSCDIAAGKKAYDTITFLQSDLEDNDITDIKELELRFTVFNSDTWGAILDTDIITVTFE
jgi:hypothetical protein